MIIDCGELKRGENWGLEENDGTNDVFTPWPDDWYYESCVDKLTVSIFNKLIFNIRLKKLK